MTRAKVPPDQRQRIAQACDSCKKRKQKCDGDQPCSTCSKRQFVCQYTQPSNHHATHAEKVARRRERQEKQERQLESAPQIQMRPQQMALPGPHSNVSYPPGPMSEPMGIDSELTKAARSLQRISYPQVRVNQEDRTKSFLSIVTGLSGNEGEAIMYSQMRMLQDPTGRLLFLGESANVSFLALLRALTEPVVGHCSFIEDPRRHMITEPLFSLDTNTKVPPILPDLKSALLLSNAFFDNTQGFIYVFERGRFLSALTQTYEDPLAAEPEWLIQLNLVFAIGLMMATPPENSDEAELINRIRDQHTDRAEAFYLAARSLSDPLTGLEDADFWSIQALLLMSFYMLTKAKRNASFALLGMAVRSAYALGLHRQDTFSVFPVAQQVSRRNLWKSLFVMDRFLALSLGRPPAIYEDEVYARPTPRTSISSDISTSTAVESSQEASNVDAMEAAIRATSLIGVILKQIYQNRSIGTGLAKDLAVKCKEWPNKIASSLKFPSPSYPHAANAIAVMHVNLLHIHSAILLTRPFFLYVFNEEMQKLANPGRGAPPRRGYPTIKRFSEACVSAATHTVNLARGCFESGILARSNPLVVYFVSSAGLVLLANEFANLHNHPQAERCIKDAFRIMRYCGKMDSQADRFNYIMETFSEMITMHREKTGRSNGQGGSNNQLPPLMRGPSGNVTDMPPGPLLPSPTGFNNVAPNTPFQPPFSNGSIGPNPFAPSPGPSFAAHSPIPPTGFHPSIKSSSSTPTPVEPLPNRTAPPNPLSPAPNRTPLTAGPLGFEPNNALGYNNLVDFIMPFNNDGMNGIEDTSIPDEQIDFDVFWSWNNAQAGNVMGMNAPGAVQPVNADQSGMVPTLYGVMNG